jgi:hypothetical protein
MPATLPCPLQPIDMHVHVVGNGLSGSGCWSKLNLYRRIFADLLLRGIGFRTPLPDPDFDDHFAAHLAALVRESSLSHAVILAHDEVYSADGRKLSHGSFHTSNDWVLELARRHPELLPAVSIHPARQDALRELDRCIEAGAVMVKLLPPSHNVDCSLPAYRPFWQRMADARIPLLSHTGGEYTVPVVDKSLFHPEKLRLPLDCGVTVIAAHAGTRSAPGFMETNHLPTFVRMLAEYPHLYGDNSALNTINRSHGLRPCLDAAVMPRIVHGSDFPVPVSGRWAGWRGLVPPEAVRAAAAIRNPLERDYQLKLAMGFDPAVFTRAWGLLRLG